MRQVSNSEVLVQLLGIIRTSMVHKHLTKTPAKANPVCTKAKEKQMCLG